MKKLSTIPDMLGLIEADYSEPNTLNTFVDHAWKSYSTQEMIQEVKYLALGLHNLGIKKGDRVGIISLPSAQWTICDLSIMTIGAVSVPLFANVSEENLRFIAGQTDLKATFISGQDPWQHYELHRKLFGQAISLDQDPPPKGVIPYTTLVAQGEALNREKPQLYEVLRHACKPEDLATIIYTSGSTGIPKGAEHTHYSLSSLLNVDVYQLDPKKDRYLSVLPLAHVYARALNFILLAWGVPISYYNDLKNLGPACKEIKPTVMVVVPRLLEKVYAKMLATIQQSSFIKRTIGRWAFDLANREEESSWTAFCHPFAEKLVYHHLREALGGQLRVVLSGGAALDPHLYHFFLDIGIPVFEGYGLTEACPVTVNRINRTKIGTIGIPLGDLEVRTAGDGELLVRGSNVMRGYYKNPEETAQALDREGWLHTGDKATIDSDGFVTIIGRLKELFKTSTGEMVAPIPIEHALSNNAPFIEMAIVIADKRKFVSCLLMPNFTVLRALKAEKNMSDVTDEEFLNSFFIRSEMQKLLNRVNLHLNYWEQVRDYRFIPRDLTIASGELTPSLKIVRRVVETKYKDLIDSMYEKEKV